MGHRNKVKVASKPVLSNEPRVVQYGTQYLQAMEAADVVLRDAVQYAEHESKQPPPNFTDYVPAPKPLLETARVLIRALDAIRNLAYAICTYDPLKGKDLSGMNPKGVEKAIRTLSRKPQRLKGFMHDEILWFVKNLSNFRILAEVLTAPMKEEGVGTESIGGFDVHFMFHGDSAQDKTMRTAIEKCSQLVKTSDIPGYRKCLYGDVWVAGDISGKRNMMAYYRPSKDDITMLSVPRFTALSYHAFLHELAHRLWRKFLPQDVQTSWARYHNSLGGAKRPEIGVVYELGQENLEVLEYVAPKFRVRVIPVAGSRKKSYEGYIDAPALMKLVGKSEYPTLYSAKNYEEHFCEATAMYTLGTLKPDAAAAYERIVMGAKEPALDLTASAILRVANASLDPRTPVAEYLLSKGIVAVLDEVGDPQNSVSFPWSKGPNLANALNRIQGVTVHTRPDGYVVVTVPHWKSDDDRRFMWKAVQRALRMELSHEITDEVLSWLRPSAR